MSANNFRVKRRGGRYAVETAYAPSSGMRKGGAPGGGMMNTSSLLGSDLKSGLLDGIIDESTPQELQAIYRDIYYHDHISGATVDLRANLPWSDFTLVGGTDKQLEPFIEFMDRLCVKQLHPIVSTDQMVTGAFVGSLVYSAKERAFTDSIPYNYADCETQAVPLFSCDPILRLNVSAELKAFATDTSEEAVRIQQRIPPEMLQHFRSSKRVDLDPLSTLYAPRTTLSTVQYGVSYLRRVVPIYLLERLLYRGTLSEATRRQRATLHIMAGDEDWEPTDEDLGHLVSLFQSTEMDPISATVATRNSVQVQEIRAGGDFWKWTDVTDQLGDMKMRALAINDAFLSGDASYNNMETALSVFIEDLRAQRERTTQQLYYDKSFPLIAALNGLTVDSKTPNVETAAYLQSDASRILGKTGGLLIPRVQYHKELRPQADSDYMDILDKLKGYGMPIPLRMLAAAGGLNMDQLMKDLASDNELKAQIAKIKAEGAPSGGADDTGAEDDFGDSEFARFGGGARGAIKPVGYLNRDFGDTAEPFLRDSTGRKKHCFTPSETSRRQDERIHKALRALSDPNIHEAALRRVGRTSKRGNK